ncbi:MAG: hypothetical protein ABIA47_00815 [bacterium]
MAIRKSAIREDPIFNVFVAICMAIIVPVYVAQYYDGMPEQVKVAVYLAGGFMMIFAIWLTICRIGYFRELRNPERRAYAEFLKDDKLKCSLVMADQLVREHGELLAEDKVFVQMGIKYGIALPEEVHDRILGKREQHRRECDTLAADQQAMFRGLLAKLGGLPPDDEIEKLEKASTPSPGA